MARPFRYTFILILVAVGTGLAAFSGWRYARASAPINGPIVIVSIDALRADRLPAYGYAAGHTPAIDSLAAEGIVFERAYSHVPQTLPAHAALLTGRLPFENGVRDSVGFTLSPTERTLAAMLRDRGYSTGGVVSSFLLRKESGVGQGFGFFDATWPDRPDGTLILQRDGTESERIAQQWLDSAGTTRAFLFLHLAEPTVLTAQPERFAKLAPYDGRIAYADEILGRLVAYLKAHQLYDQSTIVILSDHGEGLGDHGEQGHGLLLYDEALRVPLIVKPASGAGAGRRVETPVQHIDLVPTILDLAKAPIPGNLRGRSLAPLFSKTGRFDERMIYAESLFGRYHFGWSPLTSLSDGRYRYTSGPSPELYDLQEDPASRTNLVAGRPELTTRFEKALKAMTPVARPQAMSSVTSADVARFEGLGYVGTAETPTVAPPASAERAVNVATVEIYRSAVRRLAAHEWAAAIDGFKALTAAEPASTDAWRQLAGAATRAERHEVAADAYAHVVELAPDRADAYLGGATALIRLRKFDEARRRVQRMLEAMIGDAPDISEAHALLARAALGRRNFDTARIEATRAEEMDAARPVIAYVTGRIALEQRH